MRHFWFLAVKGTRIVILKRIYSEFQKYPKLFVLLDESDNVPMKRRTMERNLSLDRKFNKLKWDRMGKQDV